MIGGTKTSYTLYQTSKFQLQVCLISMYVILLTPGMKGSKVIAIWLIFSALWIFLMVLWSESRNGSVSNVWNPVVLLFWFESYKQFRNNSHGNWWLSVCMISFLCTITDIKKHNAHQNFVQFSNYLRNAYLTHAY